MRWSMIITGYLEIVLAGEDPERVINMAMARGIRFWDIRRQEDGCYLLKVRLGGYKAIRHLVRKCRCRMRIVGKGGLPFFISRAKKRSVLLLGILFFCLMLYFLSSFVWFIEVQGNEKIETGIILNSLSNQGVKVGIPKSALDKEEVKDKLLADIKELAWAGIEVRGSKVIVEVSEKSLPPSGAENEPADIVASRAGKIEELLVLKGTALVKEGDKVQKGQPLVAGLIYPQIQINQDGSINPAGEPQKIRAHALVRARVLHRQTAQCPIVEKVNIDTGNQITVVIISYKGWEVHLKGPKTVPYQAYRTVRQVETILEGRIPGDPGEIITITYFEQEPRIYNWGLEGAYQEAARRSKEEVRKLLPADCRVISEGYEPSLTDKPDLVEVVYTLETIEDIGIYSH